MASMLRPLGGGFSAEIDESLEMRLEATAAEKRTINELAELYAILQGQSQRET